MITRLERSLSNGAHQRNGADGFFQANKKSEPVEDISMKDKTPADESLPTRHYKGFDPSMIEPFVKAEVVGEFLDMSEATVVRFAKAGFLPGYSLRQSGQRSHWRILLSEIKQSMRAKKPTDGGPLRSSARSQKRY